jgi:uncharacterized protein YjiS (DUF1127 family)
MTGNVEIERGLFDQRRLSAEQWDHFKDSAREARTQAMHDLLRGVLRSLRAVVVSGWNVTRRGWRAYAARRARNAAIRELGALDDRMLRDIGLGRSEIESVLGDPERLRAREPAVARSHQRAAWAGASPRSQRGAKPTAVSLIDRSAA